jgi:4-hydroxy-tetrahydrodipicolinate reductase
MTPAAEDRPPVRLVLLGLGRMGQALEALAPAHACAVAARLGAVDGGPAGIAAAVRDGAHVALDFSVPQAALPNAIACLEQGLPVVIGTTGWLDRLPDLEAAVRRTGGRALWAPNFAIGVQLTLALVEAAGVLVRDARQFEAHLAETHHAAKRDAPSGTALALRDVFEAAVGRPLPVSSIRVGAVPGTHELLLDAPFESVRIRHEARDRRVFADGALVAARWLAQPRPGGLYSLRDVLGIGGPRVAGGAGARAGGLP